MIFINVDLHNRLDVLEFLVNQAFTNHLITDKQTFMTAVLNREKQVPTSVDFNVAIPHGKSHVINEPFITYLSTKNSFQWDERGEDLVKHIFLIGVPENGGNKIHLKYISQVSKKLMDEAFRQKLFACKDAEAAFKQLNEINEGIKN